MQANKFVEKDPTSKNRKKQFLPIPSSQNNFHKKRLKFLRPEKGAAFWSGDSGVLDIARNDELVTWLAVVRYVLNFDFHASLQEHQEFGFGVSVGGIKAACGVSDIYRIKPFLLNLFRNPFFIDFFIKSCLVHSSQ